MTKDCQIKTSCNTVVYTLLYALARCVSSAPLGYAAGVRLHYCIFVRRRHSRDFVPGSFFLVISEVLQCLHRCTAKNVFMYGAHEVQAVGKGGKFPPATGPEAPLATSRGKSKHTCCIFILTGPETGSETLGTISRTTDLLRTERPLDSTTFRHALAPI